MPLKPQLIAEVPLTDARASALQFRYLFVTDADGLKAIDVTDPKSPRVVQNNTIRLGDAQRVFVARTYAYVAAGKDGLVIVDVEKPEAMREYQRFNANGALNDARDVIVATTNASLFAYVADGKNGLKVLQLTSPESQPKFYGFSSGAQAAADRELPDRQGCAEPVARPGARPRRGRDRQPDRSFRPARLATAESAGDAEAVPRR